MMFDSPKSSSHFKDLNSVQIELYRKRKYSHFCLFKVKVGRNVTTSSSSKSSVLFITRFLGDYYLVELMETRTFKNVFMTLTLTSPSGENASSLQCKMRNLMVKNWNTVFSVTRVFMLLFLSYFENPVSAILYWSIKLCLIQQLSDFSAGVNHVTSADRKSAEDADTTRRLLFWKQSTSFVLEDLYCDRRKSVFPVLD